MLTYNKTEIKTINQYNCRSARGRRGRVAVDRRQLRADRQQSPLAGAGVVAAPVDADLGDDDAGDDNDLNLNIEDNVIRELARSLRPQRR